MAVARCVWRLQPQAPPLCRMCRFSPLVPACRCGPVAPCQLNRSWAVCGTSFPWGARTNALWARCQTREPALMESRARLARSAPVRWEAGQALREALTQWGATLPHPLPEHPWGCSPGGVSITRSWTATLGAAVHTETGTLGGSRVAASRVAASRVVAPAGATDGTKHLPPSVGQRVKAAARSRAASGTPRAGHRW